MVRRPKQWMKPGWKLPEAVARMTCEAAFLERVAELVIRDHGSDAIRYAAAQVNQLRARGLPASADAWQRILETIKRVQARQP
jgi:hypothetical protein